MVHQLCTSINHSTCCSNRKVVAHTTDILCGPALSTVASTTCIANVSKLCTFATAHSCAATCSGFQLLEHQFTSDSSGWAAWPCFLCSVCHSKQSTIKPAISGIWRITLGMLYILSTLRSLYTLLSCSLSPSLSHCWKHSPLQSPPSTRRTQLKKPHSSASTACSIQGN